MKITVIGGTGMVGSATVTEAAGRGHEVVSASRSGRNAEGATQDVTLTLADTQAVVDLINSSDATVITVSAGRGESAQPVIDAHRALIAAAPTGRLIVVGGAGSLTTPDGTRLVDTPGFPEEDKTEALAFAEVLDLSLPRGRQRPELDPALPRPGVHRQAAHRHLRRGRRPARRQRDLRGRLRRRPGGRGREGRAPRPPLDHRQRLSPRPLTAHPPSRAGSIRPARLGRHPLRGAR